MGQNTEILYLKIHKMGKKNPQLFFQMEKGPT